MNDRNPDLFKQRSVEHVRLDEMARNIGRLKDDKSKRQQAHLLCLSLIRMLRSK